MRPFLVATALCALSSSAVFAANVCTGPGAPGGGVPGTLGYLQIYGSGSTGADINNVTAQSGQVLAVDTTGSCLVNGTTFSNFQVVTSTILNTPPATGFNLSLTVSGTAPNNENAGFSYSSVSPGVVQDLELFYQITNLTASTMTLSSGSASAVTEYICGAPTLVSGSPVTGCPNGDPLTPGGLPLTTIGAQTDGPVTIGSATIDYVDKDITGGSEVFQDPNVSGGVPEPMSLSLMGIGLLGIGLLGRRARS
jgi:hypothetical protein